MVSTGMQIPLYPLHPEPHPSGNCNARAIIVWLAQDGSIRVNETKVGRDELRSRILEIFENRAVRRVYVIADSRVSFDQFADFLSRIVGALPDLDVVLVSGQLRKEAEEEPTFECVTIIRPES
jgi:biopolymer transport protein ExbD